MAKRKEQFELDQCDEYGRRLFYALLDIEENLLSESDLKWIWKDIQRRLKKTEFQKNWTQYSLQEWVEKAKRLPEIREKVKEIFHWIRKVAETNCLQNNDTALSVITPISIRRLQVINSHTDDTSTPRANKNDIVFLYCLASGGEELKLKVTHCRITSNYKLFLEFQALQELRDQQENWPVNLFVDVGGNRFILGESKMSNGRIRLEVELAIFN